MAAFLGKDSNATALILIKGAPGQLYYKARDVNSIFQFQWEGKGHG
jgi:hypothetical protein